MSSPELRVIHEHREADVCSLHPAATVTCDSSNLVLSVQRAAREPRDVRSQAVAD